jgi:hypothetical protein
MKDYLTKLAKPISKALYGITISAGSRKPSSKAIMQALESDADEKFSFTVKQDSRVVLVARAQRKVQDKTEDYFWIVKASMNKRPTVQIFLSNDNLVTASSPDSIIKLSDPVNTSTPILISGQENNSASLYQ